MEITFKPNGLKFGALARNAPHQSNGVLISKCSTISFEIVEPREFVPILWSPTKRDYFGRTISSVTGK